MPDIPLIISQDIHAQSPKIVNEIPSESDSGAEEATDTIPETRGNNPPNFSNENKLAINNLLTQMTEFRVKEKSGD